MKLNDLTCLNYDIGVDKAVITLAGTDLDAIRELASVENLMLYDGTGNPLVAMNGFDRISSIRILMEQDACEVVFCRTETTLKELQNKVNDVAESIQSIQDIADVSALVFVNLAQTAVLDDETIAEHPTFFPEWVEKWTGKSGTILQKDGILYRAIHDVGAGQNSDPAETPSMWTRIGTADAECPQWGQPLGAHDAYALGATVLYNGKKYISKVDNNIWEPGVYGWEETEG